MPPRRLEQLRDFKFPSGFERNLATVDRRVSDLANRLGVKLERWEEDGLGWASGFVWGPAQFPTLIVEQDHAVERNSRRATTIVVDGGEAARNGHRATLDRVVALLGLDQDAISWVPEDPVAWADEARRIIDGRRRDPDAI